MSALEPSEVSPLRHLERDEIRSHRRPRALFATWLWELACALVLATPVHAWARSAWGAHPDGDAPLFREGGRALLAWLGESSPALSITTLSTFAAFVVAALMGQLVFGSLVASIATGLGERATEPRLASSVGAGARAFLPTLAVALLGGTMQLGILGLAITGASLSESWLIQKLGEGNTFWMQTALVLLAAALAASVGVFVDLAKVAVVRNLALAGPEPRSSFSCIRDACLHALSSTRAQPFAALGAWAWRALISASLVAVGAVLLYATMPRGGVALGVLFAAHQTIAGLRLVLRASWLARALRLVTA